MPAQDDISLDEKRVYDTTQSETAIYVASELGVIRVTVAGDQIGRRSLEARCTARDVAGQDGQLLVATDSGVFAGSTSGLEATGFGPAVAVGFDQGTPLAATPDGHLHQLSGDEWVSLAALPTVRAIDDGLVATAAGVFVVENGGTNLGLDDVNDVAAAGPFAATPAGLFARPEQWELCVPEPMAVVGAAGEGAHAAGDDFWVRESDGDWAMAETATDSPIVDVAYGPRPYAITANGTLLIESAQKDAGPGDEWTAWSLGVGETRSLAVPGAP